MSYNRANLRYSVRAKTSKVVDDIAAIVTKHQHKSGIIYCLSRKDCESLSEALLKELPHMQRQISFYHADLPEEEKRRRQLGWSKGDIKVMPIHP